MGTPIAILFFVAISVTGLLSFWFCFAVTLFCLFFVILVQEMVAMRNIIA